MTKKEKHQPEVFLYDMNYFNGISYPYWKEENGEYFFTDTQKVSARIHKISNVYFKKL